MSGFQAPAPATPGGGAILRGVGGVFDDGAGRWMFLLKDNAILVFPAGLAVATFIVGGVPLVAEMFGGMSERLVSRVGVWWRAWPGRCWLLASALRS